MKDKLLKLFSRAWKYFCENQQYIFACVFMVVFVFAIGYMLYCAATPKIEGPCMITVTDLNGNVLHKYYGQVRWIKHNTKPIIDIEYNHDFK